MIQLKPKLSIPLEKLWKEHKGEEYAQTTPHALSEIPESGLLFVGINPSLTRNEQERKKLIGQSLILEQRRIRSTNTLRNSLKFSKPPNCLGGTWISFICEKPARIQ